MRRLADALRMELEVISNYFSMSNEMQKPFFDGVMEG